MTADVVKLRFPYPPSAYSGGGCFPGERRLIRLDCEDIEAVEEDDA